MNVVTLLTSQISLILETVANWSSMHMRKYVNTCFDLLLARDLRLGTSNFFYCMVYWKKWSCLQVLLWYWLSRSHDRYVQMLRTVHFWVMCASFATWSSQVQRTCRQRIVMLSTKRMFRSSKGAGVLFLWLSGYVLACHRYTEVSL